MVTGPPLLSYSPASPRPALRTPQLFFTVGTIQVKPTDNGSLWGGDLPKSRVGQGTWLVLVLPPSWGSKFEEYSQWSLFALLLWEVQYFSSGLSALSSTQSYLIFVKQITLTHIEVWKFYTQKCSKFVREKIVLITITVCEITHSL